MNIFVFSCINFELTSIKQKSLNKQGPTQKNDGTIIRTGRTCKKIPCHMRDSTCRWFIVKKTKIFSSYVKHF